MSAIVGGDIAAQCAAKDTTQAGAKVFPKR
jgi:hypothetical protein